MPVQAVSPDPRYAVFLQQADFADAFHLHTPETGVDAFAAAERMVGRVPRWIALLLALRNLLVTPLGLKTGDETLPAGVVRVGMFPLMSRTPDQVVLGMDDKHLDFRLIIDSLGTGDITGTTLVRTHNLFGRIYLRLIMPFHRLIVPRMMRQILAPSG